MTSLAIATSTSTTLPAVSFHPHGHKKSSQIDNSASDSVSDNDTAAQIPTSAAQSIFGNLLQTLESVIGVQTSLPASAASTPSTPAAASAATAVTAAPAASATVAAPPSASPNVYNAASSIQAKLRSAFDTSAQNLPAGVAQNLKASGTNINASA